MAEFGERATSLTPAQGAGAEVLRPVQEQYVNDSILNTNIVGGLVDVFAKGLVNNSKAEAEARKNAIVGQYIKEETTYNQAVTTGQMSATQASARSRANANKFFASYPEYFEEFDKAGRALKGLTEMGDVEKQQQTEKAQRDKDISEASARGFQFNEGMPREVQDLQINASKAGIRAETQMAEMYKRNAEARAQGTFDQTIADREQKETSVRLVNDIAGSNLDAFGALGKSLSDAAKNGSMPYELAQAQLTERFSNIQAALQSAARVNPELAAPYRSLFNEMNDVYKKALDPKAVTDNLENEVKRIQNNAKLLALQDPKFANVVAVSSLLGNAPELGLKISGQAAAAISRMGSQTLGAPGYTPQVIGNPDIETEVLGTLKSAVGQLENPNTKNKDKVKVELTNNVNQILTQAGNMMNNGATPTQLKGVAEFFASPEYAGFVSKNQLDKQAAGAAKKTFQQLYEPAIIKGVQEKLEGYAYQGSSGPMDRGRTPTTIGSAVEAKFTGSGIVFEPRNISSDPVERQSQQAAIRELQTAQKGINQLIHIGAHMEGSTDYATYWENNKHIYMPQVYSKYQGLNIGDVKNGYRYNGGEVKDQKSWSKVNGG